MIKDYRFAGLALLAFGVIFALGFACGELASGDKCAPHYEGHPFAKPNFTFTKPHPTA